MLGRILDERQHERLSQTRSALNDLQAALAEADAPGDDRKTLENVIRGLDDLFLLVVVGEFNSGKSTFINALLGQRLLEEGVTPTTQRIGVLRWGETEKREAMREYVDLVTAPIEMLRDIAIVDTPGTNAIIREHEMITKDFVPRSDLVLFVTSAVQPFSETERTFLEAITKWGKRVVMILNKIDLLEPEERAKVEKYVLDSAADTLGVEPRVFAVAGRKALRAKVDKTGGLQESGFIELEKYIEETLDHAERIRLKLMNPLGVGIEIVDRAAEAADKRLGVLRDDIRASDDIEGQLNVYREDMVRDFEYRLATVDNVLLEFESRGLEFLDERFRVGRMMEFFQKDRIRDDFEKEVVSDTATEVERRVNEILDWIIASDLRIQTAVMQHVEARRDKYEERVLGQMGQDFATERARLLDDVHRRTRTAVESYDKVKEARRLANEMSSASAGILGIGAVSTVGAAIAVYFGAAMVDVTGILLAGAVILTSFYLIPKKRKDAQREFRRKVADVRTKVAKAMREEFERELNRSLQRIRDAIAPYTRFVRSERDKLVGQGKRLEKAREDLARIRADLKNEERKALG